MTLASPSAPQITWDQKGRRVYLNGEEVRLTFTEYEVFTRLAENAGTALLFTDLGAEAALVRVWTNRLRRKLGFESIGSVPGYGYRLDAELTIS